MPRAPVASPKPARAGPNPPSPGRRVFVVREVVAPAVPSRPMAAFVHGFSDARDATLAEVGSKGLSLIRMTRAGLAIPPGFVLEVRFFDEWFEELARGPEWSAFERALAGEGGASLESHCNRQKNLCSDLRFSPE